MTDEPAAKLLWDARQAADRIVQITAGKTFADYSSDDVLRWAVERQFAIIGEAFAVLRRIDPDLARIIAFCNVPIHGYAGLDDRLEYFHPGWRRWLLLSFRRANVDHAEMPACPKPQPWQPHGQTA